MKNTMENINGDFGENIIKNRLHSINSDDEYDFYINIQMNSFDERHFCDISIQKWSLDRNDKKILDKRFNKIDVKTYPPLILYSGYTGINRKHFLEYIQEPTMLVLFVDYLSEIIYGESVQKLQELYNENKCLNIITNKNGYNKDDRIAWKISDLKTFSEIFEINDELSFLTDNEILFLKENSKN